jgi:hypothetical protein
VSTLLHATVNMFLRNLLNVLVQIANKMGLQKKLCCDAFPWYRTDNRAFPVSSPRASIATVKISC